MHPSSSGRRSSTNPTRISMFEREEKNLSRSEQRTHTSKAKGISIGEASHIPRPRIRSSSYDRMSGRTSHLKASGKTSLCQPTTPITPARASVKPNLASTILTSSSNRLTVHTGLTTGRSLSAERINNVGSKGSTKDTRPLTDKSYQLVLLRKIDDFFHVNQCSTMLNNNGSLKPITLKMFVEVSSFLLKILNVKQELTVMNYVEELPRCAEKLHYPGVMTKSWLKTANAMHSWPNVLGWISWLVEMCQVQEFSFDKYQLENLPFMGTEQQAQSFKTELLALVECYKLWNDEKLDEEVELLEKYLQNAEIQQGVTEDDIAEAEKELEAETLKLQMLEEDSRKVDEEVECLQSTLSSLQVKKATKLNDVETKKEHIKKTCAQTSHLDAEYKVLKEQIQIRNVQREELISTVKNQSMSRIEKEEIMKKCTEIQNYIHEFNEHLKDYQKESYALDIKFACINNDTNKAVLAYNKEIFMCIDNDIDVNFDELKLPESGLLKPEMTEVLEETADLMKNFKDSLKKQYSDMGSLIHSDTIKLENLQEKIKFSLDKKKLKEERSHIDQKKIDTKKEKAKLMEQVEMLKYEIKNTENMMPNMEAMELEIEEMRDKLDAINRRKIFFENKMKEFFDEFYQIIGEHRNELHHLLIRR